MIIDGKTFGRFLGVDICSPELPKHFAGADYVFHFAGISALPVCQEQPQYAMEVNVGGTANVLEAARRAGVRRVIFASTGAIYENNTTFPTKESDPVAPTLTYAVSKLQAEQHVPGYGEMYGLEIVILRYFNVYGPHQDFMRLSPPLMSYLIREMLNDRRRCSTPTARRSATALRRRRQPAEQALHGAPAAPGEIFNVGSGVSTSVRKVFEIIAGACPAASARVSAGYEFLGRLPSLVPGTISPQARGCRTRSAQVFAGRHQQSREMLGWRAEVLHRRRADTYGRYAMKLPRKRSNKSRLIEENR